MYACLHAPGNLAALVECAREFSPYFEEISADAVLVDLRGLRLLFGSPDDIALAMTNRAGITVNLAIAYDTDTAVLAARGHKGVTIVQQGQEGPALSSLPVYLLPCSPESAAILDAWGIRTLGEFAGLPPQGIAARLGKEGTYLQRLARGAGNRHLCPVAGPLTFEQELGLESPLELLENPCHSCSGGFSESCAVRLIRIP
jgi:nucleotidyltransferase/DNA polymerase involved in DNA repair